MTNRSQHTRVARGLFAAVALLGAAVAVPAAASVTHAAASQRTLFAYTGSQTASSYWQPPVDQPASYVTPVNVAGGRAYLKLDVLSKPSSKAMQPQVCFWRDGPAARLQYETCSPAKALTFTNEGTYWLDLGAPAGWWTKAGGYDWTQQATVIRIMLKDPATNSLFLSSRCGAACYRGSDLTDHVPVQMRGELVMVAKGATLAPPASWQPICPKTWSPECGSDGGGGPGVPNVSVSAGPGSFTASWPAVTGAVRYQLLWRPTGGTTTKEPLFKTTSYTVSGLKPGTYMVSVRASDGSLWSEFSRTNVTVH